MSQIASPEGSVIRLRLLVGYLGERSQASWWPSDFLAVEAQAFLEPVFQKTRLMAALNGVTEAARRVHDERIGLGRVFHLFRLPETFEQRCFEFLQQPPLIDDVRGIENAAVGFLAAHGQIKENVSLSEEGPVKAGTKSDLENLDWVSRTSRLYAVALQQGFKSFPYFTAEE